MEAFILIFIIFIGVISGFIGGITSGGGGMISLSFLIFLGLPPQVAVATDRVGGLGYAGGAILRFLKSKKIIFRYVLPLSVLSIIGAWIGANALISIDKNLLFKIIGIIIILLLPVVLWKKDLGVVCRTKRNGLILYLGFLLYFLLSIYDGFLGTAAGILIAYLFVFVLGMTYNEANATEKIPYLFNTLISLTIFASHQIINYSYAVALLSGTLIGGFLGAHLAIKKGEKVIRIVFIFAAFLMAVKLIFFS
jgi:hypothetical protein